MSGISAGNRTPSGRRRVEQPRHAGANNLAKRIRDNFTHMMRLGVDPRWESEIGRLHLAGRLTELEVQAAWVFAQIVARFDHYHLSADRMRRTARSQAYEISRGEVDEIEKHRVSGTLKDYQRRARSAKKKYERAIAALGANTKLVTAVVLENEITPPQSVDDLRAGLADLVRQFALQVYEGDAVVENRQRERGMDLEHRVALAVEAASRWLEDEKDEVQEFRLGETGTGERGIKVWGRPGTDTQQVSRVVLIRVRNRDLIAHVDSLFLKACTAKGWRERK